MADPYKIMLRNSLASVVANATLSTYKVCEKNEIDRLVKQFHKADSQNNIQLMEQSLNRLTDFGS
jgi:hypothetical protein